ncbi:DUF6759 domain-containing protein [Epilithonimonas sp.]|uniref:DUF6759 domain-containing protein n=1 Tax=Epilithonimonas sp. TaxID=2894511 RepID=UPI0035B1BC50
MNKFLLFSLAVSLTSCATSSVSPVFVSNNSNVILASDPVKLPVKLSVEQKAVMLLNQLFNTDPSNEKMILMISNDSDCDFTMSITGKNNYILPVAAKNTESIVLERGGYEMKSEVCKTPYKSFKVLSDNTNLSIKHTVVKTDENSAMAVIQ